MGNYRILKPGEVLYARGDDADAIYIIEEGSVVVKAESGDFSLAGGDVLGAFDCWMERCYSADVIAETESKLKIISKHGQSAKMDGTLTLRLFKLFLKSIDTASPGKWS